MRKLCICLFLATTLSASAQIITPQEKSVLDIYYLGKTNQISGSQIIDGTIGFSKLTNGVQVVITSGSNAWDWVVNNSNTLNLVFSWGNHATNNYFVSTNFNGAGTTGLITSVLGDAGKYLKADGTWDTPAGIPTTNSIDTISVTTLLTTAYNSILLDGSSANVSGILPAANTVSGLVFAAKSIDRTFTTDLITQGSDKIDKLDTTLDLFLYESVSLQSDGTTNWYILP